MSKYLKLILIQKKIVKITNFNLYTNFELGLSDFTKWFVKWKKDNE